MKRTGVSQGRQGQIDRGLGGEVGRLNIRAQSEESGLLREGWKEESNRERVLSLEVGQGQVRSHISRMKVQGKRQNKRVSIFEKRGIRLREPVQSDQKDPKGGAKTHKG